MILQLAALHGETIVEQALRLVIDNDEVMSSVNVETLVIASFSCIIPLVSRIVSADHHQYVPFYLAIGGR